MFKSISASLMRVIISAVVFVGIAKAQDVVNLRPVQVTARTSDNFVVSIPVDYLEAERFKRAYASISDVDYVTDLTKSQVCQVLKQHPPKNCTTSTYPASPGIPSAGGQQWRGNGCGAGAFTTAFLTAAAKVLHPFTFSGDLDKPVKGNPSIDFGDSCYTHDENYTRSVTKDFADRAFARKLSAVCDSAVQDGSTCLVFRDAYVSTVQDHGASAYAADQQQLACSAWGSSMKKSGCSS